MDAYFGYGSLVNGATRDAGEVAHPAVLEGWRRVWGHCVRVGDRGVCALSIEPSPGTRIEGVCVELQPDRLGSLDKREQGYQRSALDQTQIRGDAPGFGTLHVYRSLPMNMGAADAEFPMWQSYIDCVLQGYLHTFGEAGMQRFVETTSGWRGVIENDRAAPRYPRSVDLSRAERDLIDREIMRVR